MKVSIIIPFYNEEENVEALLREIRECQPDAEIIAVDDGSSDATAEKIRAISGVRYLGNGKNLGQSAAMYYGLQAANGEVCVMLDGDGQNDPHDIGKLLEKIGEYDLVCGYRAKRQDNFARRLASKIGNGCRRAVLPDPIRDTGCSLKAMKRECVKHLIPFNGLHRYIAALLGSAGKKIYEIPVNHRPRQFGVSKYTIGGRALRGIYDLIGVGWYIKRQILWKKDPYRHE
ncbi:MAG: glycosyltransferase family 2 protein [Verrucomicrobiales bacterium]|jgi:dolichol-phosphate mannosyltransferase|nr:glycosyltransferase family 2 protein [Verrucomicrobiales bacterium]